MTDHDNAKRFQDWLETNIKSGDITADFFRLEDDEQEEDQE